MTIAVHGATRERLPTDRKGFVHRFVIGGQRFFLRTGQYGDGRIGEIFLEGGQHVDEEGGDTGDLSPGDTSAWADAFAAAVSIGLQYGAPLSAFADKFQHTQFEPRGVTDNPEIPRATSVLDYAFRYLIGRFGKGETDSGQR